MIYNSILKVNIDYNLQIIFILLRLCLLFSILFPFTIFLSKLFILQNAIFKYWSLLCPCWVAYMFLFCSRMFFFYSFVSASLDFLFLCIEFAVVLEHNACDCCFWIFEFCSVNTVFVYLFLILSWTWMFVLCLSISSSLDFLFSLL